MSVRSTGSGAIVGNYFDTLSPAITALVRPTCSVLYIIVSIFSLRLISLQLLQMINKQGRRSYGKELFRPSSGFSFTLMTRVKLWGHCQVWRSRLILNYFCRDSVKRLAILIYNQQTIIFIISFAWTIIV